MRTMLLSFKPSVFEKIKAGSKIFEHRRNFPNEPIKAYMYVSSPVRAITGIIYLGKRHLLSDWENEFSYDEEAVKRIKQYKENYRYVMEIDEFQETTTIPLSQLRENLDKFVAPQMYYYLDGTDLVKYIDSHIDNREIHLFHDFTNIRSTEVCRN